MSHHRHLCSTNSLERNMGMNRTLCAIFVTFLFLISTTLRSFAENTEKAPSAPRIGFRLADNQAFEGSREARIPGNETPIFIESTNRLDETAIAKAAIISTEQGRPAIALFFGEEGKQKLEKLTSENVGKRLAILLDNELVEAPKIVGTIGQRAVMHGSFSIQQAVEITHALNQTSIFSPTTTPTIPLDSFQPLFNGEDLTGWTNVNTDDDTWFVKDGLLICKGLPIGVMRSNQQYENFILHIEWRHMKPGGNSGVFVWSEGTVPAGRQLPKGMEVQMLELDWINQHPRGGNPNHVGYVSGELFGAGGLNATPDNPRGRRSMSKELRCNGAGEWNSYDVVCVDGTVNLSINGIFVNSIRGSDVRRGYLCLESEGSEIHFRNIQILELPEGLLSSNQQATVVE